jgi:hypothetical protein
MSGSGCPGLAAMRQQFADKRHLVRGRHKQDVLQVRVRIELIELGRLVDRIKFIAAAAVPIRAR